jgi:hypothetical protein
MTDDNTDDWVELPVPELDLPGYSTPRVYGPPGSTVTVDLDPRTMRFGELFDLRIVRLAFVTIAAPDGRLVCDGRAVFLEELGLRSWEGFCTLADECRTMDPPLSRPAVDGASIGLGSIRLPSGLELPLDVVDEAAMLLHEVRGLSLMLTEALADARSPDWLADQIRLTVKEAYELGGRIRELELQRAYEALAVSGLKRGPAAAKGPKSRASKWTTLGLPWLKAYRARFPGLSNRQLALKLREAAEKRDGGQGGPLPELSKLPQVGQIERKIAEWIKSGDLPDKV